MSIERALEKIHTAPDLKAFLRGMRFGPFLHMESGHSPSWVNLGQFYACGRTYGVSPEVQRYLVEYEILYDEAKSPQFKKKLVEPTHSGYAHLPRCNDLVSLTLKVIMGRIVAVGWEGQGCVIAMSSASLMSQVILGKMIDEALIQASEFAKLLQPNQKADLHVLDERLLIFEPLKINPMKAECACVGWSALVGIKSVPAK